MKSTFKAESNGACGPHVRYTNRLRLDSQLIQRPVLAEKIDLDPGELLSEPQPDGQLRIKNFSLHRHRHRHHPFMSIQVFKIPFDFFFSIDFISPGRPLRDTMKGVFLDLTIVWRRRQNAQGKRCLLYQFAVTILLRSLTGTMLSRT